ncbi:GroES-like protein [Mollisia scopiformis]|uniref:GroES-like protein n=1 Tax=Mollisia scopiformis TaxID=149040 RepID=A0A132BAL1_MOLSC|nr:GroES-like protein [Mollisia scopiformis]KUJ09452.1 GroES-like protein [Mollisia scopiformis]
MKEVFNFAGPRAEIRDSPIPEPNDDQVLIKVVVSGTNPKDWKAPDFAATLTEGPIYERIKGMKVGTNQGDDIAGIVEKVGANVVEFKLGDRVAAFHEMMTPHGSFAEYAIAWSHTTFHIPHHTSFEEAATIPLTALTSALALYRHLALPFPWLPATSPIPLVVYGASAAVGAFAIKLAQNSNIHPIIAIAGKGSHFVESIIDRSKGDTIIDYRDTFESVTQKIREAVKASGNQEVKYAIDAAIVPESAKILREVVAPDGHINFIFPNDFDVSPAMKSTSSVGSVHNQYRTEDTRELGYIFSRYLTRALQQGRLSGHPYEVRKGGLEGVEQALKDLKEGKASAVKYIVRIADTPGLK